LKGGCWSRAAGRQYEWVVRQTLRLVRHDGSQVFSRGSAGAWNEELLAAALRLGGNRRDRQIAARVLPLSGRAAKGRPARSALPKPAMHSEWAAVAVMRPRWSRSGERLVILYPGQQFQIELGCGRDLICSGQWGLDLRVDDRPAVPEGDWEQLCWYSDKDVDFLEVQLELGGGLRVQRQALLAREDRFLLLADVVLGVGSSKLDYRGCLPLCPDVRFEAAGESWEGVLAAGKPRALVLPLALPEWRARGQAGGLTRSSTGLELRQTAHARRLYAPLFFLFDRRRMAQRRTWRQLTVAESLIAQPAEVAVGYRVAIGKAQWLLYRSLGEKANRTLLGHNLSTELLVARFRRSGEVEPLLEIE
jgi:hypothetical protein